VRFRDLAGWLAWQQVAHPVEVDPGLERVGAVWRRMRLPVAATVLTVGGTNGKGSACAYLDSILRAAGYETGLFTSPHLARYNERIRVCGREIEDEALLAAFAEIDAARGETSLTFFEWNALAALVAFARVRVDVAVLEVGMGGRLDAVNLLDADAAAVVSVGLDHREWLGSTVEAIGFEKAGIFRAGRPAVFGGKLLPRSIAAHAAAIGARLQDWHGLRLRRARGWLGLRRFGSRRRSCPCLRSRA
jgi:dihydrofolate synthase/folylpolyglutamate synthase